MKTKSPEKIKQVFESNGLKVKINQSDNISYAYDENGNKNFAKQTAKAIKLR